MDASGDATEQGGLGTQADPAAVALAAQQLDDEARIAEALKDFEPTPQSGTGVAANDAEAQYWASMEQPDPRYVQEASLGNGTTGISTPAHSPELCKVYYFHTDQVGMPEELTNTDGQLVWQASYTTWGATVAEEWQVKTLANQEPIEQGDKPEGEQNLRFQGQYLDRSTGLHYNTFRYYDADMGRFICPDPIGLQGGINLAAYAPNPLSWIDPWGWCRRGNQATRDHMDSVRDQVRYDNPGILHSAGGRDAITGSNLPETYLPPLAGNTGRKGGSYTDMTFTDSQGRTVYVQTVDRGKVNGMSQREWGNAVRISQ